MVGDSLTSDIRGARNAGLRSCWYNPQHLPPRPDIVRRTTPSTPWRSCRPCWSGCERRLEKRSPANRQGTSLTNMGSRALSHFRI